MLGYQYASYAYYRCAYRIDRTCTPADSKLLVSCYYEFLVNLSVQRLPDGVDGPTAPRRVFRPPAATATNAGNSFPTDDHQPPSIICIGHLCTPATTLPQRLPVHYFASIHRKGIGLGWFEFWAVSSRDLQTWCPMVSTPVLTPSSLEHTYLRF